jgi:multidrug resistance efflux pump
MQYSVSGLGAMSGAIPFNSSTIVPIGHGLYVQFPAGTYHPDDYWTVDIPNTKATTYLTNYNAYQSAQETERQALLSADAQIRNAQTALDQANASLEVQRAAARPADVAAAKAQILSASGQVAAARAVLGNLILRAPSDGTITEIKLKVGEQASALQAVMTLQNISDLHAEANVSEANVAALKLGQTVDFTFDALGPDEHSTGTIQTINPASTVVSGVVV